jgi:Holliday junction resolvasome RuvABC endonuclease subunit
MKAVKQLSAKKDKRYIGFDTSSNALAFAIVDRKDEEWSLIHTGRIELGPKDMNGKLRVVAATIRPLFDQFGPIDVIAVEQSIMVQNAKTTIKLSQIIGALWIICIDYGIDVEVVMPLQWKAAIGYKRVMKADKVEWAKTMTPLEVKKKAAFERKDRVKRILQKDCKVVKDIDDDDIVDSIGVAKWALMNL